jgi:RNA methyltransferase, TrmH family
MMQENLTPTRRQLSEWARLTQKKFRRERGEFLIEGEICVREALRAHVSLEAILVLASEAERLEEQFATRSAPFYVVNTEIFSRLSKVENSQGIVAVARTFEISPRLGQFTIACEQVSDPGNAGALMRVADFFGARELLLGEDSAEIWNSKVVRGSMGSLFHLPVRTDVNCSELLQSWPGTSVALVAHGGEVLREKLKMKSPVLLMLGHETRGLSDDLLALCNKRVTLERKGSAESLNLVTAAAVAAFALS